MRGAWSGPRGDQGRVTCWDTRSLEGWDDGPRPTGAVRFTVIRYGRLPFPAHPPGGASGAAVSAGVRPVALEGALHVSSTRPGRRGRHRRRGRPSRAAEAAVPLAVGGTVAAVALLGPLTSAALRDGTGRPGSSAGATRHGSDGSSRTTLLSFPESAQPTTEASAVPTAQPDSAGAAGAVGAGASSGAGGSDPAGGTAISPGSGSVTASGGSTGGSAAEPAPQPTGDPTGSATSEPTEPTEPTE